MALLAGAVYANTLGYELVWDDPISIQRWLPALDDAWSVFFPPAGIPQFPRDYYRPLQLLSYRFDAYVGHGAAWAFHLSPVLFHVVASTLVLLVGRILFASRRFGEWAALAAATFFAVHPIHTESVAWMAARPDPMVACFGLGAFVAYWKSGWSEGRRAAVAAALIFAALLCKENAVSLLLLVPLSASLLGPSRGALRRLSGPGWPTAAVFAVVVAFYAGLRSAAIGGAASSAFTLPPNPLLHLVGGVGTYLRLVIFPYPLNAYISEVPLDPIALLVGMSLLAASAVAALWAWKSPEPVLSFCLLWFYLTLAPALALLFQPPAAPLAERYLYLPSIAWCWIVGSAVAYFGERQRGRLPVATAFSAFLAVSAAWTMARNGVWENNLRLWSDSATHTSTDGFALRNLAAETLRRGDSATAERLFQQALSRRNSVRGQAAIHNNLGSLEFHRGDYTAAERSYRKALDLDPSADAAYNLGLLYLHRGTSGELAAEDRAAQLSEAHRLLAQAVEASPFDAEAQVAFAQANEAMNKPEAARRHFEEALRLGLPAETAAAVRKRLDR